MAEAAQVFVTTGKRKTAVARLRMKHGDGKIIVNNKPMAEYFGGLETSKLIIKQPLEITNTLGRYDIVVTLRGGGKVGGASAIRHGITRALMLADPGFRTPLKRARGLGSAKDGTHHFVVQRITAIALIFLSIYVVGLVIWLVGADYATVRATVAHPVNAVLLVAFVIASF